MLRHRASQQPNFCPLRCATSAAGNSINSPRSIYITISFKVLCDLSIKSDKEVCSKKMVYFNALNLVSPRYSPDIPKISKEYIWSLRFILSKIIVLHLCLFLHILILSVFRIRFFLTSVKWHKFSKRSSSRKFGRCMLCLSSHVHMFFTCSPDLGCLLIFWQGNKKCMFLCKKVCYGVFVETIKTKTV